jgi:hypothetical protein
VIDNIGAAKGVLQLAVSAANSKILSLAECGKLAPPAPADEPANVLLERTQAEKEILGGSGASAKKAATAQRQAWITFICRYA